MASIFAFLGEVSEELYDVAIGSRGGCVGQPARDPYPWQII